MLPTAALPGSTSYTLVSNAKLARVAYVLNAGSLGYLRLDSSTGATLLQTGTASGTTALVIELGIPLEKGRVIYNSGAQALLIFE